MDLKKNSQSFSSRLPKKINHINPGDVIKYTRSQNNPASTTNTPVFQNQNNQASAANNTLNLIPKYTPKEIYEIFGHTPGDNETPRFTPVQERNNQGGSGFPPLYPNKMLISLVKLLVRIYAGYDSKEIMEKTKQLLDTLYNSRLITNTVYNQLANL